MADSSLVDIYEDLSVDRWSKREIEEGDNRIDLFTEALAVDTIDKVQNQLLELKRENDKLRQENAKLQESKIQLTKNISSLFLTAKREIQKKEEQITKLMQGESSKVMPDKLIETSRKAENPYFKKPEDTHLTSVTNKFSGGPSKVEKRQGEIRGRLMQEINQSYSLSSCQGVASRKSHKGVQAVNQSVQNRINNTSTSKTQHTFYKEVKLQHISSTKDRDVIERKQDKIHGRHHKISTFSSKYKYVRSNESPIDKTPTYSSTSNKNSKQSTRNKIPAYSSTPDKYYNQTTVHNTTASKECKSVAQKKKTQTILETDLKEYANTQKIETAKSRIIRSSQKLQESEDSFSCEQQEIESCSGPDRTVSTSFVLESSAHSNKELAINEHSDAVRRAHSWQFDLEPEKEMDNTLSPHVNSADNIFGLNTSEKSSATYERHSVQNDQSSESSGQYTETNGNVKFHGSCGKSAKTVDNESVTTEKYEVEDSANGNGKIEENFDIDNPESNCNLKSYMCPYNVTLSAKRGASLDLTRNKKRRIDVQEECPKVTRNYQQNCDTEKDTRHTKSSSRHFKKTRDKINHVSGKDSNCNSSGAPFCKEKTCSSNGPIEPGDFETSSDLNVNSMPQITYITCTSNLILLGDEETTCTTTASPNKLQPSEFYPPGVRGDVHEGGSHVRHIRGFTEVIKKVQSDINYSIVNEQDNSSRVYNTARDGNDQLNMSSVANSTTAATLDTPSLSDNISNCYKTQRRHEFERQENLSKNDQMSNCKVLEALRKSQTSNNSDEPVESNLPYNESSESTDDDLNLA